MMEYIWFWLAKDLVALSFVLVLFLIYAVWMVALEIGEARRKRRRGK